MGIDINFSASITRDERKILCHSIVNVSYWISNGLFFKEISMNKKIDLDHYLIRRSQARILGVFGYILSPILVD